MTFARDFSLNGTFYKEGQDASSLDKQILKALEQRGVLKPKSESRANSTTKPKTAKKEQ